MNKNKERYCSPTVSSFVVRFEGNLLETQENGTETGNKVTPGEGDGWGDGWGN